MASTTLDGAEPHQALVNGYLIGQTPPTPLSRRAAQQLQLRRSWLREAAALASTPIFFESSFKRYQPWYVIGLLVIVSVCSRPSPLFLWADES